MRKYRSLRWQGLEDLDTRLRGLNRIGVIVTKGDDDTITVTLPNGWKILPAPSHSGNRGFGALPPGGPVRLKTINDEKGRGRAFILESGGDDDEERMFLDARAFTYYRVACHGIYDWNACDAKDNTLYGVDTISRNANVLAMSDEKAMAEIEAWLDGHFSRWRDPAAYWD